MNVPVRIGARRTVILAERKPLGSREGTHRYREGDLGRVEEPVERIPEGERSTRRTGEGLENHVDVRARERGVEIRAAVVGSHRQLLRRS